MKFEKGDRVQLSEEGRVAQVVGNKHLNRLGVVATDPQNQAYIAVVWDGTKTLQRFAARFIEHVPMVEIEIPVELENDTEHE